MPNPTRLLYGQGTTASVPTLWEAAPVSTDGGAPFALVARSRPLAPAGQGGECVFWRVHLVVTASMGATLRVTPLVDSDDPAALTLATPVGTLEVLAPTIALAQAAPTADGYPRTTSRVTVPLVRRRVDALGAEQERWALRGAQIALQIDTVGTLGTGELRLDGVEIEYSIVRKARFDPVAT